MPLDPLTSGGTQTRCVLGLLDAAKQLSRKCAAVIRRDEVSRPAVFDHLGQRSDGGDDAWQAVSHGLEDDQTIGLESGRKTEDACVRVELRQPLPVVNGAESLDPGLLRCFCRADDLKASRRHAGSNRAERLDQPVATFTMELAANEEHNGIARVVTGFGESIEVHPCADGSHAAFGYAVVVDDRPRDRTAHREDCAARW
jgi:hypothetical protein